MRRAAVALCAFATLIGGPAGSDDRPVVDVVRFGLDGDRTRIVIESDRPLELPQVFTLAEQGARVVVDLESVAFELDGDGDGKGLVTGYRYAEHSDSGSRVVFDLAEPASVGEPFKLEPAPNSDGYRLVIDLHPTSAAQFQANAGYPRGAAEESNSAAPAPSDDAAPSRGTRLVVIDPGHGGYDHGAAGVDGALEKTVNLALARDLRDRLEAAGYEVVLTRDDDSFVELDERVRIARRIGADLMISIHADADAGSSSTHGASVYTLADYAENRSRTEILAEDPWIVGVDLTRRSEDVGNIIVDLVQGDTQAQSASFAEILLPHLEDAGPLLGNAHRRRGLKVLLAPDVPAALIEAGFMTNPADEARLTSRTDRGVLADAIAAAVDDYFDQRERLYAAQ